MKPWKEQGCTMCRNAWESGKAQAYLTFVGEFVVMHTRLYRCPSCNAIWEEEERYTHEISEAEAHTKYLDARL